MLNRLSYRIDELLREGKIDYDTYLNLRELSDQLGDENEKLHKKLEDSIELPLFQQSGEVVNIFYRDKSGLVCTEQFFTDEWYKGSEGRGIRGLEAAKQFFNGLEERNV